MATRVNRAAIGSSLNPGPVVPGRVPLPHTYQQPGRTGQAAADRAGPDAGHGDGGRARAVAEEWGQRGVSRGGPRGDPPVSRADAIRGRPVRGRLASRYRGTPHVTLAAARSSPAAPARARP